MGVLIDKGYIFTLVNIYASSAQLRKKRKHRAKMKVTKFILQILFITIPTIGMGQIDCENEQIELLKLKLIPAFQNSSSIQIECDSNRLTLNFKTFESREGKMKTEENLIIPEDLYYDFKEVILPLEIKSMKEKPNPRLNDGLAAEITFLDRYGHFNRFTTRIPIKRNRNVFLIETIISLTEKLEISPESQKYLKNIREWYLSYCK